MNRIVAGAFAASFLWFPAHADGIGIQFNEMEVGTKLITETRDDDPRRYIEEYLGKQGEFHVVELSRNKNGDVSPILKQFYDAEGRLVRKEKDGQLSSEYTPFSCEYVIGPCQHTYVYANPFKDGKLVTHRDKRYDNRLDGDILTVSLERSGQSALDIPYKLGRYRFRVSSEFTNALGQARGYKLIEIVEP